MTAKQRKPSPQDTRTDAPLVAAASALEADLRRFEEATLAARKIALTSQKGLERGAAALREALDFQERFAERLRAMGDALNAARERHNATLATAQERSDEIVRRQSELSALMTQFEAIGTEAGRITAELRESGVPTAPGGDGAGDAARMRDVGTRMSDLAVKAGDLAAAATAADALELARQADSLKQQLQAARNKLSLLEQRIGESTPRRRA